jgi:outer membrane lipoprotein-sorting protein
VLAAALVAMAPAVPVGAAAAPQDAAWQAVETFRRNLERSSPFTAKFVQTYLPEGFSTGEKETGRMALNLPSCLRWDYDQPYPKSFILCGDVIHYWNPGETEGHVDEIDAEREPGLDLLLVGVDELRRRYDASVERSSKSVAITLRPTAKNDFVTEATLELDPKLDRLVSLRYLDPEGNRTEFQISGYQSGVAGGTFNYPKDVTWLDEY